MRRTIKFLVMILSLMLILMACSKKSEEVIEIELDEDEPEEIEEVEEPEPEPELFTAPFSGMKIEEENDMRPVLATINNDPKARPQSGLNEADIIYEFMTEGLTTRFLALFQNELPEKIGPIRSARDMFIHTAKGLDAFYIAHGYSPDALALLQANYVDHVNGMQHDGTLFKRAADRYAPHNSYISGENIQLGAENIVARMTIEKMPELSFYESIEDVKHGEQVTEFTVSQGSKPHFTSDYVYNELAGTYERTVNGALTIDKETEETTEIANILVFETDHQTIDSVGRQKIDIESGGKAMLFQAGFMHEIEWENRDGMLLPVKNGQVVELVPGLTWIHIISQNPGIEKIVLLDSE